MKMAIMECLLDTWMVAKLQERLAPESVPKKLASKSDLKI